MYEEQVCEVEEIVGRNNDWRLRTLNLIASENVMSNRARKVMGSDFTHRYAEGHPGERYYQGTEYIDEIEAEVKKYVKALFNCAHSEVRPVSGTNANEAVFSRFVRPNIAVLVNSTPGGGHISHHRAGSVGKFTQHILEFPLTPDGYHTDVEKALDLIHRHTSRWTKFPLKVLILGKSLFLFPEPVRELASICREKDIILIYDAAHILGLIAGKAFQDALTEGADILVASTHKTFPGPQRGLILSNMPGNLWQRIDRGAFPGSSSNHHLDTLPPLAITLYEMLEFGEAYARQIVKNAKALGKNLDAHGFKVEAKEFGYTETHQIAVDVSGFGGGALVSVKLKDNDIILNMNLLPFESVERSVNPAGIRIGVQEMTRFGMKEKEMEYIADLMKECIMDGKTVKEEVTAFRKKFQRIEYSFDDRPCRFD